MFSTKDKQPAALRALHLSYEKARRGLSFLSWPYKEGKGFCWRSQCVVQEASELTACLVVPLRIYRGIDTLTDVIESCQFTSRSNDSQFLQAYDWPVRPTCWWSMDICLKTQQICQHLKSHMKKIWVLKPGPGWRDDSDGKVLPT